MNLREIDKVLIAGDWHGNSAWAVSVIDHAAEAGAQAIVQVGDFGLWTPGPSTSSFIYRVSERARTRNIHVYWLDGNHEDHSRKFSDYDNDHLTYLPRGTRWEWFGKTFMAVGGAVSVDKLWRTEGKSWWPGETLTRKDVDYCKRLGKVDVVLSHDCPAGVDIPGLTGDWPMSVLLEAQDHRELVREIWAAKRPELWIHGHYHVGYRSRLEETEVFGLDCDGGADTVMELTADTFAPRTVCDL